MPFRRCFIVLITLAGLAAGEAEPARPAPLSDLERFPYVVGSQTIGVKYGFTRDTRLVETAKAILATGSNILKITLGQQTFTSYQLPRDGTLTDLAALAAREPSVKTVLDMPFAHYLFWTSPMAGDGWAERFGDAERQRQYREIHDLVRHLLTAYNGTGKTFYLGHWEGDWLLRRGKPGGGYETGADATRVANMIAWLTTRQQAIDDAKRDTPHAEVQVWGYTEVNRVMDDLVPGHHGLCNDVLPHIDIDFVSYSSYDATGGDPATVRDRLGRAIAHIESKLRPRPGITGRRVFIGEFGTPALHARTPERFEALARNVFLAGLEQDCPLVLFWEMYCNETEKDGRHRGYWLIDDQGNKTSLYQTFSAFQRESRAWVAEYRRTNGHVPDREGFRRQAIAILSALPAPVVPAVR